MQPYLKRQLNFIPFIKGCNEQNTPFYLYKHKDCITETNGKSKNFRKNYKQQCFAYCCINGLCSNRRKENPWTVLWLNFFFRFLLLNEVNEHTEKGIKCMVEEVMFFFCFYYFIFINVQCPTSIVPYSNVLVFFLFTKKNCC